VCFCEGGKGFTQGKKKKLARGREGAKQERRRDVSRIPTEGLQRGELRGKVGVKTSTWGGGTFCQKLIRA